MTFHVGQKVVCVDASVSSYFGTRPPLVRGGIYTVTAVIPPLAHWPDDAWGLLVAEASPLHPLAVGFVANRFRPIVEKKTDISCFTALLNPSPSKVIERV